MKKNRSAVLEALRDFDSLPGVFGVFVSAEEDVFEAISRLYEPEKLETIASHISRAFNKSNDAGVGADRIVFSYSNGIVVSRAFNERACLNVLCDSKVQLSSLDLLVDVVINKIIKEIKKESEAPEAAPSSSTPGEVLKGSLSPVMKKISDALCNHIGPAGDIILSDALEKWCCSGPAEESRLSELVNIIGSELGSGGSEALLTDIRKDIPH